MSQKIIITRQKANKYRNTKTMRDGYLFDSRKEADRYTQLSVLERAGIITNLETQPKFRIEINGVKICDYRADFRYVRDGQTVVEDVKSEMTRKLPVYRLKNKLMLAVWKIQILET